jgi:hypothetical protein
MGSNANWSLTTGAPLYNAGIGAGNGVSKRDLI